MNENKDGRRSSRFSKPASKLASTDSYPLVLDIEDFKSGFSFDALFGNLVNELLPSHLEEESDASKGHGGNDVMPNGHLRNLSDIGKSAQGLSSPLFPKVVALLSLFRNSCTQLIDLRKEIDRKLYNLGKEVAAQDARHWKTLSEDK